MGDLLFVMLVVGGLAIFFYRKWKSSEPVCPPANDPLVAVAEEPVAEVPVKEAPVKEVPVKEVPVKEAPVKEVPVKEAPVKETPVKEAPVKETPVKEAPVKEAPVKEAPVKEVPVKEAPVKEAPVKEAPTEETVQNALAWRMLQRVVKKPGILQVELYKAFPREKRKHLQTTLLQLDKDQLLRREKEGNSYRLFPV
jgi:hypothetical protein